MSIVEIRVSPTPIEAGDAALVNRGGAPAMVVLGTAAAADAADFATAAQGALAGTALQPGAQIPWADVTGEPDFAAVATSGAYSDLTGLPVLFDGAWSSLSGVPATFPPEAHGHTAGEISGLATVATTGAYSDLSGLPTLGAVAALDVGTTAGTVAAGDHGHGDATTSVAGFMAAADKEKLDGVAAGATVGATWGTDLSGVPAVISGTTASFTTAQESKLAGIATGATANAADAALRDRSTHTGTQAISTVDGLQEALDARAPAATVGDGLGTSGTVNLDLAALDGSVQRIALTGAITVTASNRAAGRSVALLLSEDGTAPRVVTWPAGWRAVGETLPEVVSDGAVWVAVECLGADDADVYAAAAEVV